MSAAPEVPTPDAAQAAFLEELARLKAWWDAWSAAHPGLANPFADVMAGVLSGLTPERIAAAVSAAPKEFWDFLANKEGPITPGGDPSAFA